MSWKLSAMFLVANLIRIHSMISHSLGTVITVSVDKLQTIRKAVFDYMLSNFLLTTNCKAKWMYRFADPLGNYCSNASLSNAPMIAFSFYSEI